MYVQAFLGQPYVGITVIDGDARTLYEPAIEITRWAADNDDTWQSVFFEANIARYDRLAHRHDDALAKLLDLERKKREEEIAGITGEQQNVGFGSQIRSYVMQPYQMVKDLRSEHETAQVDSVLGGDIEPFMEAWLRWTRAQAADA